MEHRRDEEKAAGRYRLPICSSAIPHTHDDTDPPRASIAGINPHG